MTEPAAVDVATRHIQRALQDFAEPAVRDWWESYLKGAIEFRGVRMAHIRSVAHGWYETVGGDWHQRRLRTLCTTLLQQDLAEDKLAGMLLLQEILIPAGHIPWPTDLQRWARLFDDGHIRDWNTCDWFCVRVLGPLAQLNGEPCARRIAGWSRARNLWRRRAAGVAFVNLAAEGDRNFPGFADMLIEVCERTVRSPERFAQTGVGWVLRELSRSEPNRVTAFLREHADLISNEAARMAAAKLPPHLAEEILNARGLRVTGRRR